MTETMNATGTSNEEPLIMTTETHKRINEEAINAYRIFSILYGLVVFFGGVAFSVSYAIVQGERAEMIKILARSYFIYLYWVSIIWITFCMIDIHRYQRISNKCKSASSEANRKSSMATYADLQVHHVSEDITTSNDRDNKLNSLKDLSHLSLTKKSSTDIRKSVQIHENTHNTIEQHDRKDHVVKHTIGYNYDKNSTVDGLYTRIGIGIFCLGTVIHSALSILSNLENHLCIRWISVVDNSSRLLFSFTQFFFIFKHSDLIIRSHQKLARLAIMHIVVTNLCVWFRMVVVETKSQILEMREHGVGLSQHSITVNHLITVNQSTIYPSRHLLNFNRECFKLRATGLPISTFIYEGYMRLTPILYPCTIEFSLMCLTLFCLIWKNIDKTFLHKISDNASTKNVFLVNCHASTKGLFAGLIVFSCTMISIILYGVLRHKSDDSFHMTQSSLAHTPSNTNTATISDPTFYANAILETGNLCLLTLSLCATVWSLIRVRKLNYHRTTSRFDDVLMIVSLTGIYLYSVFSAFAIISNLSSSTWIAHVKLAVIILEFVEGTVHTLFILVVLRKRLRPTSKHEYPAREMIALLIILDLSLWVQKTTTTTKFEANTTQLKFYNVIPWSIIAATATPLQIFFRFHASVCLSSVWGDMYKLPVYDPMSSSEL
ncbi:unnamed protein product [Adineta ricciae]|uniref:Uncharacterized protein n=1 Tax=Adineta ricciae TaxID=249248 RepID=A0A815RWE5_ADIRI|nr:unnamed protein product [Adineta ricciae]